MIVASGWILPSHPANKTKTFFAWRMMRKENSQFHLMFHSSAAKVCRTGGLLHGSHRRLVPRYGIAGSNGRRLL